MSHRPLFSLVLALCALGGAARAQTSTIDPCPNMGTRFVPAYATIDQTVLCSGTTVRVNGITVTTGRTHPNSCPTVVTYYPAHYESGVEKQGFRLGTKISLPLTVFHRECRSSYLLFLDLGSSCDFVARFESGYIDSWSEEVCRVATQVAVRRG
jgi:hypothetical protein